MLAGEGSDQERDGRLAQPLQRVGRGSGGARLSHRCDHVTDHPFVGAILGRHGIERGGAHRPVRISQEANEDGPIVGDDPSSAHRHGGGAAVGGFGRAGEAGDERRDLRGRPRVSARCELDECPHAHLGIGMVGQLLEVGSGCLGLDAGKQVEAEANVSNVG